MTSSAVILDGFIHRLVICDKDGTVVDEEIVHNLIPQVGVDFLIRSPFGDTAPISTFYCGLFAGNYIPSSSTTAADIPTNMQEFTNYSETTRPVWNRAYDEVGTMDNIANRAQFTVTQDRTVYGAFLVSSSTKGGNNGLLLSVVRFASPKPLTTGQTAQLISGITYVPTNIV